MKALKILGVVLAIFLVGYLIDWIAGRQERAILAPIREATAAIEAEDFSRLERALEPDFSYGSTVSWVGQGDLEGARGKLASFWPRVEFVAVILRESRVEAGEKEARAELTGNVKFAGESGGFAIYKFRMSAQLRNASGSWKVFRIDLPQLEPGLF